MVGYVEDFMFVASSIVEFLKRDFRKLDFADSVASLPHPSGKGDILCGAEAYRRLRSISRIGISRSRYAGRISEDSVFSELKSIFVKNFIHDGREINHDESNRAVSAAIKAAAKKIIDIAHYIPCDIANEKSPTDFRIGPVRFVKRDILLKDIDPQLNAYLSDTHGGCDLVMLSRLLSDAVAYYESFSWIAEVKVNGCDNKTSRERAARMVQGAIDCLHLLIGTAYSTHLRMGGPAMGFDKRGLIEIDANDKARISTSSSWRVHSLGENWWTWLNQEGGDEAIELMGIALEGAYATPKPLPMAQRFIDAATWFGEAARDTFAASRTIKYVTAIERILTTRNDSDITKTLAERGAALTYVPGHSNLDCLKAKFASVYDLRSRLVHGSRSPNEIGIGSGLRDAEELSRTVLLCALVRLFQKEGLQMPDVSGKRLEQGYLDAVAWAHRTARSTEPA